MKLRCVLGCLAALVLALLSLATAAQSRLPPGVDGPGAGLATRSVSQYLALERQLIESFRQADRTLVLQQLAETFEFRSASTPEAMSGVEWIESEWRDRLDAGAVRELSVREFGDTAVVSFLLDQRRVVKGRKLASTLYIVDVWSQSPRRLEARYVSNTRPGGPIPARPSGRE